MRPDVAGELLAGNDGFDPVSDLTTAQPARPAHLSQVNMRTLSPYHRALLVTDGTVTKFIEAYTMEPVDIRRVSQETRTLHSDDPWLQAPAGTQVLRREVIIEGRYSGSVYAHAVSSMIESRLPPAVRHRLDVEGGGLGRILNDSRLETRREILWFGRERAGSQPESDVLGSSGEVITRTYRILHGGKPLVLICERFPRGADRSPTHE
ncbi:MAG TPA: chorismate pyruvate-lyase family protein [Candidatus Methylomirabilis sp.]